MDLANDHNVYIFGAGFSREANLPLISDFLIRMRDSHPWLVSNGRHTEAESVQKVLEFRLFAASAAYWTVLDLENIEELFSLASASAGTLNSHIQQAIGATIDFCLANRKDSLGKLEIPNPPWTTTPAWLQKTHPGPLTTTPTFLVPRYTHHIAKLLGLFRDGTPTGRNSFITFN